MQGRYDDASVSLSGTCSRSRSRSEGSGSGEGVALVHRPKASDEAKGEEPKEEAEQNCVQNVRNDSRPMTRDTCPNFDADSMLSSLTSRVFLDVLSACALGPSLPDGTSSFAGADNVSEGENSLSDLGLEASHAPSLSISSIARAERMLHKAVPLVNGGRHIALTAEDVERIHDSELLHFLEENSALFVKYLQRPAASSSPPPLIEEGDEGEEKARGPQTIPLASAGREEMERTMRQIETGIATFITAFDNSGHAYRICVDDDGRLLVPVADMADDAENFKDENADDENDENDDDDSHSSYSSSSSHSSGNIHNSPGGCDVDKEHRDAAPNGAELRASRPSAPPRLGRRVRLSPAASAKPKADPVAKPEFKPKAPAEAKPKPKGTKPKAKGRERVPVRLLGLTEEEDRRVEALLRGDWNTEPSPYAFPDATMKRLAEIDERLRCLREIRGATKAEHGESENEKNESAQEEEEEKTEAAEAAEGAKVESVIGNGSAHDSRGNVRAGAKDRAKRTNLQGPVMPSVTARSLGDAYLREVRERRQYESRLREINAGLSKLHREAELCAMRPSEDAERLAQRPAPRWVSEELPPPICEEDIAALLAAARAETEAATARGYGQVCAPPRGDGAVNYLREQMQGALARVAALLPDVEMDGTGD